MKSTFKLLSDQTVIFKMEVYSVKQFLKNMIFRKDKKRKF